MSVLRGDYREALFLFRVLEQGGTMSASNEAELEEIISSFRRVWRSGGRASLSLHANQGELEARVVNILKATSATNRKI